jgi:hypothetical protein
MAITAIKPDTADVMGVAELNRLLDELVLAGQPR